MAPATPAAPTLATLAGYAALDFEELPEVEVDVELAEDPPALEVAVEPAPVPPPVPDPEPLVAAAVPVPAEPLTALPTQLESEPGLMVNGALWAIRPLLSRRVKSS